MKKYKLLTSRQAMPIINQRCSSGRTVVALITDKRLVDIKSTRINLFPITFKILNKCLTATIESSGITKPTILLSEYCVLCSPDNYKHVLTTLEATKQGVIHSMAMPSNKLDLLYDD
jgi:hypothetical protein